MSARNAGNEVTSNAQTRWSEFTHSLEILGLLDFLTSFSPQFIGTQNWERGLANAPPELQSAIRFLCLGSHVPKSNLQSICSLDLLVSSGIAEEDGLNLVLPDLILVFIGNAWIWVQRQRPNPSIYFGHDTYALMARLRVRTPARFLDLCAGPGTQGLWAAQHGATVVSVERNFRPARIARLNVALNGLDSQMTVVEGDLYSALAADTPTFDVIAANPPLLPFPNEEFYPFVGHGGDDGLAITWRILEGLTMQLSRDGVAIIIGTCISDGLLPCSASTMAEVASRNRLDIRLSIVGHAPFTRGEPMFQGLVTTAALSGSSSGADKISDALEQIVARVNGSHLCYFSMSARHGVGRFSVLDLSGESTSAGWFVL